VLEEFAKLSDVKTGVREQGYLFSTVAHLRGRKELSMMDLVVLAIGLGLFAVSVGYVLACERL
jgi:hypothetical protein